MSGIFVSIKPPTEAGRLYPRYDEESEILVVESRIQRRWPYGIDIDGSLIIDLDENRTLANFDLHIPKRLWEKNQKNDFIFLAPPGDLEFRPQTVNKKSYSLVLHPLYDKEAKTLYIKIGTNAPDRAVSLSEFCSALLADDELVGFYLKRISW